METRPHRDSARTKAASFATREGYLAPVFLALMFVANALRLPEPFGMMFSTTCWAGAWLFAISGLRRGGFGARIAAGLVLAILFCQIAFVVVLLYH